MSQCSSFKGDSTESGGTESGGTEPGGIEAVGTEAGTLEVGSTEAGATGAGYAKTAGTAEETGFKGSNFGANPVCLFLRFAGRLVIDVCSVGGQGGRGNDVRTRGIER